jgi:hypothetical protein
MHGRLAQQSVLRQVERGFQVGRLGDDVGGLALGQVHGDLPTPVVAPVGGHLLDLDAFGGERPTDAFGGFGAGAGVGDRVRVAVLGVHLHLAGVDAAGPAAPHPGGDGGHRVQGHHPQAAFDGAIGGGSGDGGGGDTAGDEVALPALLHLGGAPLHDRVGLRLLRHIALRGLRLRPGRTDHLRVVADHLVPLDTGDVPPAARGPADPDHGGVVADGAGGTAGDRSLGVNPGGQLPLRGRRALVDDRLDRPDNGRGPAVVGVC